MPAGGFSDDEYGTATAVGRSLRSRILADPSALARYVQATAEIDSHQGGTCKPAPDLEA